MDEFTIIQDGRLFVVIDKRGESRFDSYWEQDCREWLDNRREWYNDIYDDDY